MAATMSVMSTRLSVRPATAQRPASIPSLPMRLSMVPRKVAAQATVTLKTPDGEHKIEVVSTINTCASLFPAGLSYVFVLLACRRAQKHMFKYRKLRLVLDFSSGVLSQAV